MLMGRAKASDDRLGVRQDPLTSLCQRYSPWTPH